MSEEKNDQIDKVGKDDKIGKNEKRAERRNKICELVESEFYTPMKEKELAAFMQVDKSDRGELSDI
ncbi:MAG: hypothetical protein K2O57_08685, partial [Acetatifactor sp.]|nr:hypothetical protein [Acetatifactor sp.]